MDRGRVRGPGQAELAAVRGRTIPDLLGPDLAVLLVGINPSLYSAYRGRHFARPGNRMRRTLHESGLTDRRLDPDEQELLPSLGIGITNLVAAATARADELSREELRAGAARLGRVVSRLQPRHVAVLGITAYRHAFDRPRAAAGRQGEPLAGATLWVLPNPSGLNASYQQPALTAAYRELAAAAFPDRCPAG